MRLPIAPVCRDLPSRSERISFFVGNIFWARRRPSVEFSSYLGDVEDLQREDDEHSTNSKHSATHLHPSLAEWLVIVGAQVSRDGC